MHMDKTGTQTTSRSLQACALRRASQYSKAHSLAKKQPRFKIKKTWILFFHFMEVPSWSPDSSQLYATRWQQRRQHRQPGPRSPTDGRGGGGGRQEEGRGKRTGHEVGVYALAVRENRRGNVGRISRVDRKY